MKRILYHIIVPAIIPAAFFVVAAMPVEVLGCRNRSLIAVLIALIGALASLGAVIMGLFGKVRGKPSAGWWVLSALMLAIPAVVIIIIAQ